MNESFFDSIKFELEYLQDWCDEHLGGFHIQVSPLPWDWRWRFYRDEIDRSFFEATVGPVCFRSSLRFWKVDPEAFKKMQGFTPHSVIVDEVAEWSGVSPISKGRTWEPIPVEDLDHG